MTSARHRSFLVQPHRADNVIFWLLLPPFRPRVRALWLSLDAREKLHGFLFPMKYMQMIQLSSFAFGFVCYTPMLGS